MTEGKIDYRQIIQDAVIKSRERQVALLEAIVGRTLAQLNAGHFVVNKFGYAVVSIETYTLPSTQELDAIHFDVKSALYNNGLVLIRLAVSGGLVNVEMTITSEPVENGEVPEDDDEE